MATTFEVIYLGSLPLIDTVQNNEIVENASGILGSYGTTAAPLSGRVQTLSAERLSEDDNDSYDLDNGGGHDSFRINGGAPQNFDAVAIYNATLTYADGSTATISAVVFQDVNGNTYLAPDETATPSQAALTAKPIVSLSLNSVTANSGDMAADRVAGDFISSVDGTAGSDTMNLGYTDAQGDRIGTGNDFVAAGAGNDSVSAGGGADTVFGGTGADTITAGDGNDSVDGGDGNDVIGSWDFDAGNDTFRGGAGDDTIYGGLGNDSIYGDAGNDVLSGGGGADTIFGGLGNDSAGVTEDHGTDVYDLGEQDGDWDAIWFSNWQSATGVNITFTGTDAGTYGYSGGGATGSFSGAEQVGGTEYADTINAANDTNGGQIFGNGGADLITGGSGDDSIWGGTGNDSISGGAGADTLFGGDGDDTLIGGDGNDTLEGGGGADSLTGGSGADLFVLTVSGDADRISDFDMTLDAGRTADQLDVSELRTPAGEPITWRDVVVTDTVGDGSGDAVLTFPSGEVVILEGVSPDQVNSKQALASIGVPCFAAGTQLLTPTGWQPIETLRLGAMVQTSAGPQPVIWVGARQLDAGDFARNPELRPIHFPIGALGNRAPLRLSPQHAVLMADAKGKHKLLRAKHLAEIGFCGARVAKGVKAVSYHHILLKNHAILCAEGTAAESFYPGPEAMAMLDWPARLAVMGAIGGDLGHITRGNFASVSDLYGPRVYPLVGKGAIAGCSPASFKQLVLPTVSPVSKQRQLLRISHF